MKKKLCVFVPLLLFYTKPMKKRMILLLCFCMLVSPEVSAQESGQSYEEFRQGLRKNYAEFRQSLLDDYDKYLEGIWREYNAFRGVRRDTVPKPVHAPVAPADADPSVSRMLDPVADAVPAPVVVPLPSEREPVRQPSVPPVSAEDAFLFHGVSIKVPKVDVGTCPDKIADKEYAALWRRFREKGVDRLLVPALREAASSCRLNDWFTFRLVCAYVDARHASSSASLRVTLSHYLLCHMGYNVRLARDEGDRPFLLVAIRQMVYGQVYSVIGGERYYVCFDALSRRESTDLLSFHTCELPVGAEGRGRPLDLLLTQAPLVPYEAYRYRIGAEGLAIEGELNANLMPMLYRYPQMDVENYACSMLCPDVRESVVSSLRGQLEGMPRLQAVNALLRFVQHAFAYATDDERHGFEKPYFFEEILYYPQCDCEDRAVFYSYLLWEVLGVENHLVFFPGHACVAVRLDEPVEGTSYSYEGHRFYISDPTYIGSVTGECMPAYLNERPEIRLSR